MLMSAYVNEQLTIKEGLFRDSHVTPAARANDTTDVWAVRHGCYTKEPVQPFRSATIDHIQCGKIECERDGEIPGANLGLYSVTFINDLEHDRDTLLAFKEFREEAERKNFVTSWKSSIPTRPAASRRRKWASLSTTKSCAAWPA
jgi:hypothetical protein